MWAKWWAYNAALCQSRVVDSNRFTSAAPARLGMPSPPFRDSREERPTYIQAVMIR